MTDFQDAIIYPAAIVALLMSYSVGANDLANALGTSVGSKAIKLKTAVILAGIFEFLGVILLGRLVSDTLKSSIVNPSNFAQEPQLFALGMFCASIAASVWLLVATLLKLPVSTTHSIVGGIVSFGLIEKGWSSINHAQFSKTLVSWIISPLMGASMSFLFTLFTRKVVTEVHNKNKRARHMFPFFCSFTIALIASFVLIKQKKSLPWDWVKKDWVAPVISIGLFVLIYLLVQFVVLRYFGHLLFKSSDESIMMDEEDFNEEANLKSSSIVHNEKDEVLIKNQEPAQRMFIPLMIITAASISFAHGSNDIANALGPFSVVFEFWKQGNYLTSLALPFWIYLLAGIALVLGLATLGYRVIETVGGDIVPLTFSKGFTATLAASTTVLTATVLAIPVSTTHVLIGSVTGTSLTSAHDIKQIKWFTLIKIMASWFVTFFVGAGITAILYLSLKDIFLV